MKIFKIILNKPNEIYFSGETITGSLNLQIKERLKIRSVKLLITGFSKVYWHYNDQSFNGSEEYFNELIYFKKKESDTDLYLEPGDYNFPFSFLLPENLPASFEHLLGKVKYYIFGTIDIPWAFDKSTEKTITVLSHYDLNLDQVLQKPYGVLKKEELSCSLCRKGSITISFSLTKIGFVPGENIEFKIVFENKTKQVFNNLRLKLRQNMTFNAAKKSRSEYRNLNAIQLQNNMIEGTIKNFLSIPSAPPSTNNNCRLIEVSYEVVFKYDPAGIAQDTMLSIPITIGTVPIPDSANSQMNLFFSSSLFEPLKLGWEDSFRGQLVETNIDTYRPFYPFYQKN